MQGGAPSEFEVTPKGERAIDSFLTSAVGSVLSFYEYGLLQVAKEGLLTNYNILERYGTEGSRVIRQLQSKGLLTTTPRIDDLESES